MVFMQTLLNDTKTLDFGPRSPTDQFSFKDAPQYFPRVLISSWVSSGIRSPAFPLSRISQPPSQPNTGSSTRAA